MIPAWLKAHLFPCPSMYYFNIPCPGCGMQRAMILLLEGKWNESFLMYPALIPLLGTSLLFLWGSKYQFPHRKVIMIGSYAMCAGMMLLNMLIKFMENLSMQPLN